MISLSFELCSAAFTELGTRLIDMNKTQWRCKRLTVNNDFGRLGLLICAVAAAFVGGRVCWSINHKQFNHK